MSAGVYNFTKDGCDGSPLEVGATFSYQLAWEVELIAGSGDYVPVDLTGYSAKMDVRKTIASPLIVSLSSANGRITFEPTRGLINLVIPAAITAVLPSGLYKYDLDLTDTNGFVTRFIQGSFEIVGSITA